MLKTIAAIAAFFVAFGPLAASANQFGELDLSPGTIVAMDRTQTLTGMNPESTWINLDKRNIRIGDGAFWWNTLCRSSISCSGFYANLGVLPVTGLYVAVGPSNANTVGTLYQFLPEETSGYGGYPSGVGTYLAADPTQVVLQGIAASNTTNIGPLNPPGTTGQSINYLIECKVITVDTTSQTINVVSSGGSVTSTTANRDRDDGIGCMSKAGTAATTGSQTTPGVDSGYVAIGAVAVPYGTSTINSGMVSVQLGQAFYGFAQLNSSGGLNLPSGIIQALEFQASTNGTGATGMVSGDISLARSANTAAEFFGTNGAQYLDFGISNSSAWTLHGGSLFVPLGNISATNSVLANIVDTSGNSASGMSGGDIRAGRSGGSTGVVDFGNGTTHYLDFGLANTGAFTLNGGGLVTPNLVASASNTFSAPSTYVAGDIDAQRNDHQGVVVMGGAGSAGGWDWNINNSNALSAKIVGGGYANFSAGTYTNASDRRWKKDITTVPYGLSMVMQLQPRTFTWKSDDRRDLGFIAQEVQPLMPELVHQDRKGYYLMNYQGLIPVLTLAIQQQQTEIYCLVAALGLVLALLIWVLICVRTITRGVE